MLSLERCRQLLEDGTTVSDSDLERVREGLYLFARAAIQSYREGKRSDQSGKGDRLGAVTRAGPFHVPSARLGESERLELEEQAAIFEYDAGSDRDSAERRACEIWMNRRE